MGLACALPYLRIKSRFDQFPDDITVRTTTNGTATDLKIPRPYARDPFLEMMVK